MNIDQSRIEDLVARRSESLNVEIKRWITTDEANEIARASPEHRALYRHEPDAVSVLLEPGRAAHRLRALN